MRRVVSNFFPFVEVAWEVRGQQGTALAFLDTGFDGFLILPADWFGQLGTPDTLDWWQLADGSYIITPAYEGTITVLGLEQAIPGKIVLVGGEVIVGLRLLRRYLVTLERGQRVVIEL